MANQVATGAGEAFTHGTGAGGSLRMAYQEAACADRAFAHGTGAGSRSYLGAGQGFLVRQRRGRWLALGRPEGVGQGFRVRHGRGRSLALGRRGKTFSYDAGAGGGSHLADQEASGAGKAFAYGTGGGGARTWQSFEMACDTATAH